MGKQSWEILGEEEEGEGISIPSHPSNEKRRDRRDINPFFFIPHPTSSSSPRKGKFLSLQSFSRLKKIIFLEHVLCKDFAIDSGWYMQKYELRSILNIGSNFSLCSIAGVLVCSEQSSVLLKNAHDFPENFAKNVCGLFSGKKFPPGLFFRQ